MITLHNEIVNILNEAGKSLSTNQIAGLVNTRKNYLKRDNSEVTDFQIHGRTRNYKNLFNRSGTTVMLKYNAEVYSDAKPLNEQIKENKIK